MDVSIIIVNYNTKELLKNCLYSIFEQTETITFEVIVSDNGSTDGSGEMVKTDFPAVVLLENGANLGFGAANNQGAKIAKGKYIFYLNSDAVLLNNAVKQFYDFWESYPEPEQLGALGCNLLDENHTIVESYSIFPTIFLEIKNCVFLIARSLVITLMFVLHINYKCFFKKKAAVKKLGAVDFICGAAFFLKNNSSVYFDELFFLYYEETDLQYTLREQGKIRLMIDGPGICHLHRGSDVSPGIYKQLGGMAVIYASISRIQYLSKHKFSVFGIAIIKILTCILWLNPFLFCHTKKYFHKMVLV